MRKINAVFGIFITAVFLVHLIAGGLLLSGIMNVSDGFMKISAFTLLSAVLIHTVIGVKLTADTFGAVKRSGVSYTAHNGSFWIRRISGAAVMLFIAAHAAEFMCGGEGVPVPDVPKLICSVLLVVSVMIHCVTNIRPLANGLGLDAPKSAVTVSALVLGILLALSGAAFVVYFVRFGL